MKGLKPQRLSMLHRFVEHERAHTMVVSVLVYVPFEAPRKLFTEQVLWKDVGEHIPGGIVDEGLPKPLGEVLVSGAAYARQEGGAKAVKVKLSAERGPSTLLEKELAVWGNRYWQGSEPTEPAPFEVMPLDWTGSFGGPELAQNPDGKGAAPIETELSTCSCPHRSKWKIPIRAIMGTILGSEGLNWRNSRSCKLSSAPNRCAWGERHSRSYLLGCVT